MKEFPVDLKGKEMTRENVISALEDKLWGLEDKMVDLMSDGKSIDEVESKITELEEMIYDLKSGKGEFPDEK